MGSPKVENDCKQDLDDSGYVQDASMTERYRGQAHLLDLSDDVLLCILRLCSPRDLKALGHTCPRLGTLVCDRTLWQTVDARAEFTGPERLRWYITHALSHSTRELQVKGYVNRDVRCLGIQDLTWPMGDPSQMNANSAVDVEHFLLRMWYPHLPRYAMSPRWPDKREAQGKLASKAAKKAREKENNATTGEPAPANSSTSTSDSSNTDSKSSTSKSKSSTTDSKSSTSNSKANERPKDMQKIVSSCQGPQFTMNQSLFKMLRSTCQNLTSLSLEYCHLDFKETNIRFFPRKLKRLSLKGTMCYNLPVNTSYLGKIQERLPELESLDISECEWFEPASLMPLSKVPNLQELYMRDCRRLTECVAYASLSTRYGFQKLRKLDTRGSPVADSEVSAFGWLPQLEELYVSSPEDFRNTSEHSHKWEDVLAPFKELEEWEIDEPDYYKCKYPPPEVEDEEEAKEDDEPKCPGQRFGDMMGGYINCGSLERRIIVIHPSRDNRVHRVQAPGAGPPAGPPAGPQMGPNAEANAGPQVAPQAAPQAGPEAGPQPVPPAGPPAGAPEPPQAPPRQQDENPRSPRVGPSKRPHPDNALDLVKRPRVDKDDNNDKMDEDQDISKSQAKQVKDDLKKDGVNKGTDEPDDDMGEGDDSDGDDDKGNEREKVKERSDKDKDPKDAEVRPPPVPVRVRPDEAEIRPGDVETVHVYVNVDSNQRLVDVGVGPGPGPIDEEPGPEIADAQPEDLLEPPPEFERQEPFLNQQDIDAIEEADLLTDRSFLEMAYENLNQCDPGHHDHILYCRPFPNRRQPENRDEGAARTRQNERPADPNIELGPEPVAEDFPNRNLTEEEKRARIAENNENMRRDFLELAGLNNLDPEHDHLLYYRPVSCRRVRSVCTERTCPNRGENSGQNGGQNAGQNQGAANPGPAGQPEAGPSRSNHNPLEVLQSERFRLNDGESAHVRIRGPNAHISIRNGVPGENRPNQVAEVEIRRRIDPDEENQNGAEANQQNQNEQEDVSIDERPMSPEPDVIEEPIVPQIIQRNIPFPAIRQNREPIRHIDIDIHRQNFPFPNLGYHLVSDAAVIRFGRADNDNINYIDIGHNQNGQEAGVRPDRSNLRILSITGFRNITDRSLEHLATAAPHLQFIDFSYTNVTPEGVSIFKAIRPNCKVVFSKYGQPN